MKVSRSESSLAMGPFRGRGEAATVQMNSYAPCPEVIYPQDTADDIPAHFIEHQDFPDRVTIFIQDRSGVRDKTAGP